jgi:hypothetical protein
MKTQTQPDTRTSPSATITPTPRTTLRRRPARGSHDREVIHAILDEGLVAAVGFVGDGGQPYVLPMAYVRRGEEIVLHGAAANRLLQHAAGGAALCVTVTLLDGLVLARSAFSHSMNYRSVVVLGRARAIEAADEKRAAMAALVDHILPGRSAQVRPPDEKELAATRVLAVPIVEASAKIRAGGPVDGEEDLAVPCWAGHLPLHLAAGLPIADARGVLHAVPPAGLANYGGGAPGVPGPGRSLIE